MSRVLQLGNSANWDQIYTTSVSAVRVTPDTHAPIPEITIPFLLEVHVIAVYVFTDIPEGRRWFFAGFLNQKFELGLTVGGTPDADELSRRKLTLNRIKLVIFPKITANYSVSFSVPEWFTSVSITVWQYLGPDYDSVEKAVEEIKLLLQNSQGEINEMG
jgi:hypothetical protein